MPDINQALLARDGPIWQSSGISSAERTNLNATAVATEIPIAAGTKMIRISPETNVDYTIWITEQGMTAPNKATPPDGGMTVNGTLQEGFDIWFDTEDYPEVWFGEIGSSDLTVHVTFYR